MAGKKKKSEVLEMVARITRESEIKTGCIGCVFNDKGFCLKKERWCSKVPKDSDNICSYRVDYTPEEINAKKEDPNIRVISGWGEYVHTNKHKPWDMPL